jgi:hypothetical protein
MGRYVEDQETIARTSKNQDLYQDIYSSLPSSNVLVPNNESEIDISKLKELTENREGYRRIKDYQSVLNTPASEDEHEEYDIYEDIDNKIYDINQILEDAKSKRVLTDREKYHNLRNTQYNILSKLDLDEKINEDSEEMVTDFFTKDKTGNDFITALHNELTETKGDAVASNKTSADLFDNLKGEGDTILTEAVKEDKIKTVPSGEDSTFYTNHLSFTKDDFEGLQTLQTTVKKNNRLIKVLITIFTIILIAVIAVLIYTLL